MAQLQRSTGPSAIAATLLRTAGTDSGIPNIEGFKDKILAEKKKRKPSGNAYVDNFLSNLGGG
jgi:hypothetical protein